MWNKNSPFCESKDNANTIAFFKKDFVYLFLERMEGRRKRGRETLAATQARALTGNRTRHPSVRRSALNPLSHTSQGTFVLGELL